MKLLFIIDNLQFFRDIFRSPILPRLLEEPETQVIIATTYSPEAIDREFGHARLKVYALKTRTSTLLSNFFYSLAKDVYTVEQPDGSFTQKRLTEASQAGRGSLGMRLGIARLLRALGLSSKVLSSTASNFGGDADFARMLAQEKPTMAVFSTMLPGVGEWLKAARQQHVPLVLSVASWDNPTSKGPMAVAPDYAVVWAPEMQLEMERFHGMARDRVKPVGVIYFESYFHHATLMERTAFCKALNIDPACKILHYATGDSTLIKCNQEFIRVVHRLIESGQLGIPCHLLVRVSPKDVFSLYKEFESLPHVTVQYPKGDGSLYGGHKWLPAADEDVERASTIKNSDVILSVSSSMVLDACCFDVPVVNLAYDAGLKVAPWESVERFFVYSHCQPVLEENATWVVKDDAALATALKACLQNPQTKQKERRRLLERVIGYTDGKTHERFVNALREIGAHVSSK